MSFRSSIFLFFACAAPAWAGSVTLSVEGAADHALTRNPPLAAARLRIEEARESALIRSLTGDVSMNAPPNTRGGRLSAPPSTTDG